MRRDTRQSPAVVMFSGQGSHYHQMGRELMGLDPVFTRVLEEGDAVLASLGREGFLRQLYDPPKSRPWRDLTWTHPALVIVQWAVFRALDSRGFVPDAVLGSSVGVFPAAVASGVLDFPSAVEAAWDQARAVVEHCRPGGILAVIADPEVYRSSPRLRELVHLAGVNFSQHFVLSGLGPEVSEARRVLTEGGIACQELVVGYPFHHPAIEAARASFLDAFERRVPTLRPPRLPWITADGRVGADDLQVTRSAFFFDAVAEPMEFGRTVMALDAVGPWRFVDAGPAGTLANFVKYALPPGSASRSIPLLTPFHQGVEHLEALAGDR